ncbi:unnamed protein product [Rodentolepis nana]|uniref:Uncharacterized protein n=1 Tax=Rodentolepis nana TaxID=102285 RepID=A0A0R3TG76_RODNA|nr:unnamed protein product [Rodentolepis nana]
MLAVGALQTGNNVQLTKLRENNASRRLNLQPGFGIRKYHYSSRPQIFDDSESGVWTLNREGGLPPNSGGSIRRVAAQRRPEQYVRAFTLRSLDHPFMRCSDQVAAKNPGISTDLWVMD